jgi:iron complex outermembrane recepter protein
MKVGDDKQYWYGDAPGMPMETHGKTTGERRGVRVSPFLTYVHDYVDARLYGADVAAFMPLAVPGDFGRFTVKGLVGYVVGENRTTGDNLYNVMPIDPKLSLEHRLGNWTSAIESQFVDTRDNVFDKQYELPLGGAYVGQRQTLSATGVPYGIAVPGAGVSFYAGLGYRL